MKACNKVYSRMIFGLMMLCFCGVFFAQNTESATTTNNEKEISLRYSFTGTYVLVERSNWSKYINGKYVGLTSRESRGYLKSGEKTSEGGIPYSGDFYVLEKTRRESIVKGSQIDEIEPVKFIVLPDGTLEFVEESFYPQLRNFPVFPEEKVSPGDRWQSTAYRVVDPKNTKEYTVFEIPVEYQFIGEEVYKSKNVYKIRAKFATRLMQYNLPEIYDQNMKNATGTHDVDIIVDAENCSVIMMIDKCDETFTYRDGESIRYRGTTSYFTEIPVPVEKSQLYQRALIASQDLPEGNNFLVDEKNFGGQKSGSGLSSTEKNGFGEMGGNSTDGKEGASGMKNSYGNEDNFEKTGSSEKNKADNSGKITEENVSSLLGTTPGNSENKQEGYFAVEDTDKGVRLSIRNLQFQADSAILLPGEEKRLDKVAEVLKTVPKGTFLIEGHTASVGKESGEKQLSVERAQMVVKELVKRGLSEEQFMFTGYGGTRPIGDNNTNEGRALNRRVEITILQ